MNKPNKKIYFCNCWRHCGGGRWNIKITYDRHEQFRVPQDVVLLEEPIEMEDVLDDDGQDIVSEDAWGASSSPQPEYLEDFDMEHQLPCSSIIASVPSPVITPQTTNESLDHSVSNFQTEGRFGEIETNPAPPLEFEIPAFLLADISPAVLPETSPEPDLADDNPNIPDPGSLDESDSEPTYRPLPEPESLEFDLEAQSGTVRLESLKDSLAYIQAIKSASLDDFYSQQTPVLVESIRNPPCILHEFDNADERLAIDIYLAIQNAPEGTYETIRNAYVRRHPDSNLLSLHGVKQTISRITGVLPITNDMCINSCMAYVGAYLTHEICPYCAEPRYVNIPGAKRASRQKFSTFPLGPQLQAMWRNPKSASQMRYRTRFTHENLEKLKSGIPIDVFSDVLQGTDYLNAVRDGNIKNGDTILMLSLDGAQLYRNKESDCWIYIWVVLDHSPSTRYKKENVLIGGVIPGPNKPKNLEGFLFPGIHHLSALQREGLLIWDAKHPEKKPFLSHPFFAIGAADGPGMTYLNGLVGHVGRVGCRLFCGQPGRRRADGRKYYPAKLKPTGIYDVPGCNQPNHDCDPYSAQPDVYMKQLQYVLQSPNNAEYERRRLETGISRPSLFLGLPVHRILGVPSCFVGDIMHLGSLNITDLMIKLWRGVLKCATTDSVTTWGWATLRNETTWKMHGKQVANATPYLPGSFDRPPRNPAEKINSGYKAWEFMLYFYGLGPALFLEVLPFQYWQHFCKLVFAMRILNQHEIQRKELDAAHKMLMEFTMEFETLYYQQRADRLHFVRPSIHALSHLAQEVYRVGPPICTSQWTMERAIGYLTAQIRQSSTVYANLTAICLRQCQINALISIHPEFSNIHTTLPTGAVNLGHDYVLLHPKQSTPSSIAPEELSALAQYLASIGYNNYASVLRRNAPPLSRWARLRLPNGQIARSAWKEKKKDLDKLRMARNVKIIQGGRTDFAEVQYFLNLRLQPRASLSGANPPGQFEDITVAVLHLYSPPDMQLLVSSHYTLWSTQFLGSEGTIVVSPEAIVSVVGMVPHDPFRNGETRWFVVEKPGLDVAKMGGTINEPMD